MKNVLVCLLVVASVIALDQPAVAEAQERQGLYSGAGAPALQEQRPAGFPAPQEQRPAGYAAAALNSLRQEQPARYAQVNISPVAAGEGAAQAVFARQQQQPSVVLGRQEQQSLVFARPEQQSVLISRQEQPSVAFARQEQPSVILRQEQPSVSFARQEQPAVITSTANPLAGGLSAEALQRIEQSGVQQTSNNIDEQIQVDVSTPYPVTYERRIAVNANRPTTEAAPRAVNVQVSQSFPTEAPRAAPAALPQSAPTAFPQSAPQSFPFAFPQSYSFPASTFSFDAAPQFQTYSAPLFNQYGSYAQFPAFANSAPASFDFQSSRIASPQRSSSEVLSTRQLETAVPTQAAPVASGQTFRLNAPALAPQIFYNGAPSFVSQPAIYSTARPILAQPEFSFQQPAFNFQQPIFSARQLNVELSPLAPATVAPITLDAINTAIPTALPLTISTVAPTPLPITLQSVQANYDGPSHAYLPPESNSIKKR